MISVICLQVLIRTIFSTRNPPTGSLHNVAFTTYGCFLKLWYPTTMGFPTKKWSFWGVLEVLPFKETPISVPGPSPPWHSSHQSSKIQPEELSKRNFVLVSSLGSQKKENRRSVSSYVMEIEKGCLVVALDSDVFFLEVVWLLLGEFTVHVIFDMYWYLCDVFTSILDCAILCLYIYIFSSYLWYLCTTHL